MKHRSILLGIMLSIIFIFNSPAQQDDFPILKGPYLGQNPPGTTPVIFAPEILSKSQPEWAFDSVFSPCGNEFYFTIFDQEKKIDRIMFMKRVDNIWTKPEAASFNSDFNSHNLCISPDGYRIFFKSWRPLPGNDTPEKHSFIWFVHRTKNGWSEPQPVEYDNVYLPAGHPSITYSGTIYFRYRSENNLGNADIHLSRFVNGSFSTPVNLGRSINTDYIEGDTCVAPDESYLVVACWDRPDNNGESDLYVSFRKNDGSWTALENMGKPVNEEHNENNPMISSDGKYLFYMSVDISSETPKCSTYWVDAKIINWYKPEELKK